MGTYTLIDLKNASATREDWPKNDVSSMGDASIDAALGLMARMEARCLMELGCGKSTMVLHSLVLKHCCLCDQVQFDRLENRGAAFFAHEPLLKVLFYPQEKDAEDEGIIQTIQKELATNWKEWDTLLVDDDLPKCIMDTLLAPLHTTSNARLVIVDDLHWLERAKLVDELVDNYGGELLFLVPDVNYPPRVTGYVHFPKVD